MFQTMISLYIAPYADIIAIVLFAAGLLLTPLGFLTSFLVKDQKAKSRLRIAGMIGIGCLIALAGLFVLNFSVPW